MSRSKFRDEDAVPEGLWRKIKERELSMKTIEEIIAANEGVQKAGLETLYRICEKPEEFVMHIPVQPTDPDVLISGALNSGERVTEALRKAVEALREIGRIDLAEGEAMEALADIRSILNGKVPENGKAWSEIPGQKTRLG